MEVNMAKKKEIDTSMFWDPRRTLTHNSLVNVIVGNRGGGKSYGFKEIAIDDFIKKKEQFGYIRRYKDDLKEPMVQFFKDIEHKYPEYEFRTDSKYFYIRLRPADPKQKWTEDDIAGFGFVLSTASIRKSISYPRVTKLGFDEFLIDKGNQRYLTNEPNKLMDLYETVARPGTGHPRVVLFMMANAITITNPYFLFWDLKMPNRMDGNGKWIWKHPTRPILVEDVRNETFIDAKKNTEFGSLVAGTRYSEYSIDNKFLLDSSTFIEKKSAKARFCFSFIYKDKRFGVWVDYAEGKMWVSESYDPSHPLVYSLTMKDHSPNTMLIKSRRSSTQFGRFVTNYKMGNVYFETMNIKNMCYEVIQMVLT